jgi:hypothetical protein
VTDGRGITPIGSRGGPRRVHMTEEFPRWQRGLSADRSAKVDAAIVRVVKGGPTLGRPRVDVIHGSRLAKLKEAGRREPEK